MVIITVFFLFLFELRFKTYGRPYVIIPEFSFREKCGFRTLQLLRITLHKSYGRINVHSECNAGRSGDLRSGLTRDYSKKLSSMETSLFDEENQAFFTADCGRLQIPFPSPHSLSVNGSSGVAPGKTIRSQSIALRHKVATPTLYITPMPRTEYRYCALFAVILGRTQNLHFARDGWFMQRRSYIHSSLPLPRAFCMCVCVCVCV